MMLIVVLRKENVNLCDIQTINNTNLSIKIRDLLKQSPKDAKNVFKILNKRTKFESSTICLQLPSCYEFVLTEKAFN